MWIRQSTPAARKACGKAPKCIGLIVCYSGKNVLHTFCKPPLFMAPSFIATAKVSAKTKRISFSIVTGIAITPICRLMAFGTQLLKSTFYEAESVQLYKHLVNHIFIVQRKSPQIAMILLARIHIAPIRVRLCGDQMLFDGIR